ncbi:MAG: ADP-ribosylglycohydrolase family protein [Clostridia bacterium]|nr:ADP-ribosylglycohydrolase family protein [Clostridia bacterium]
MKKLLALILLIIICIFAVACGDGEDTSDISADTFDPNAKGIYSDTQLYDKVLGGWAGQMAGVVYGADVEFYYRGEIMPEDAVVDFSALNINNAFWQDDLYVEMTFLKVMEQNGFDCSIDLLGEAFAKSEYPLDHANKQARENLQNGIPAAESGHYDNNLHCDDIDWQIEADFIGLICGGDVQKAADRAYEIGHMICYGDGVYGGVFVAALNASAFIADDVNQAVDMALSVIPDGTEFKTVMNQVVSRYEKGKTWEECWEYIEELWGNDDRCVEFSKYDSNIDAKLNAAYVLMGILYGEGDFEKSLTIALRCGQDNDCNASTVGGFLGVMYGFDAIPEKYKNGLTKTGTKFSYTEYDLEGAVNATVNLLKNRLTSPREGYWLVLGGETSFVPTEQWPEAPTVVFTAIAEKNKVKINVNALSVPGIANTVLDFGNGFVTHENVAGYKYSAPGEYTITCTVTDIKGNVTVATQTVTVTEVEDVIIGNVGERRNIASFMVPICSVTSPTGTGNKDIFIINNGAAGVSLNTQYDTYNGYLNTHKDYVGYLFDGTYLVDSVVFTEGMNFDNGGWFSDGDIKVQALINGTWTYVSKLKVSPKYPSGNTQADFGSHFDVYTFTFTPLECEGIRIIGTAGGSAGFISVSELEVMGSEIIEIVERE